MKDNCLPNHYQSIFHQLFEHASDHDCSILLLEEILEVGDEKEIPLLEELENCEDHKVSNKAFEVKTKLFQKLGITVPEKAKKLPMSLCFLYDEFGIRPARLDPDLNMDFEVSLDIFETE